MSVTKVCQQCGENFEIIQSKADKGRGKFCSRECYGQYKENKVTKTCKRCGEQFKARQSRSNRKFCSQECSSRYNSRTIIKFCQECGDMFITYPQENGKFCSHKCANRYSGRNRSKRWEEKARNNPLDWSKDIAYLSGLVTSDGNLSSNGFRISFDSKDRDLVDQFKEISENHLDINDNAPKKKTKGDSYWWKYRFSSRRLYYFFENIGLTPNKSNSLGELNIPDDMFPDWLRGEIDGDGCWSEHQNGLRLEIASGSKKFLSWISDELHNRNLVTGAGNVTPVGSAYHIQFFDKDSRNLAPKIYNNANYYLERKYNIVKQFVRGV